MTIEQYGVIYRALLTAKISATVTLKMTDNTWRRERAQADLADAEAALHTLEHAYIRRAA